MAAVPGQALLLAAGLGTRLRPLTLVRAKPALPVAGVPLARRIISWLSRGGVSDIVVNLHHLPATVTRVLGDGTDLDVRVRYSWEQPVVLGSAGGPRQALDTIGAETFFIVNGDTLTDADLATLTARHFDSGALVTMALTPNREPLRYGGVLLNGDSRVTGFVPPGPQAAGSFHFIGVQIAHATAFGRLARGRPAQSIGGLYDTLIAEQPGSIAACISDALFRDIGTVADYIETSRSLAKEDPTVSDSIRVHPDATVTRSILWDDVAVGGGATLDECIVTDGVRVASGKIYRRAILRRGDDDQPIVEALDGYL